MAQRIQPSEASERLSLSQGWQYLDVRSIPEFDAGHPPGGFNIPLLHAQGGQKVPNPDFVQEVEANFPKEARLIVGCLSGGRSAQAAALLEASGYTSVVDMQGGFGGACDPMGRRTVPGWSEAGLPVETDAQPGRAYADLKKK
jgi:rhodanese-related sulfurtransferase